MCILFKELFIFPYRRGMGCILYAGRLCAGLMVSHP